MTEKETKIKTIEHPLENALDIAQGTTMVEYQETPPGELSIIPDYDKKDNEIEEQLEDIRTKAIDAFDAQQDITETVEGKYAARSGEVAAQFLNTALDAIREKSNLKQHKDKVAIKSSETGPKTVNNNLVITADRNEILKMLQKAKDAEDHILENPK